MHARNLLECQGDHKDCKDCASTTMQCLRNILDQHF